MADGREDDFVATGTDVRLLDSVVTSDEFHDDSRPLVRVLTIFLCVFLMVAIGVRSIMHVQTPLAPKEVAAGGFAAKSKLVLISIDGFRHDYMNRRNRTGRNEFLAPTLRALGRSGSASSMQPVMPSKTFPNHNSIATGLFPAWSGIVGNTMYNPDTNKWFHLSEKDPSWWKGEPIWKTLRSAGRTTASVFWPGSNIAGRTADLFWDYDGSTPYEKRVDRVVSLLSGTAPDLPVNKSADFVVLYFEGVDHAGHAEGPDSVEVDYEIARVDIAIADLLRKAGDISLVIVSDHGMAALDNGKILDLDSAVTKHTAMSITVSPTLFLRNESVLAENLFSSLNSLTLQKGHAQIYLKESLPERWYLRDSPLVPSIVGVAEVGWTMKLLNADSEVGSHPNMSVSTREALNHPKRGNHGFDNAAAEMQAIFIASGPAFLRADSLPDMRAVDVYPLLCHVFAVQPSPNNGSLARTRHLVKTLL